MNAPTIAARAPARAGRCRYRLALPLPAPASNDPGNTALSTSSPRRRRTAHGRDLDTTGEHPPWRSMATSQTTNPSRRRPAVGDRAVSGAATPPGTGPTPDTTTGHHPGHRHARGTSPMATPAPTPSEPVPQDPTPPRRRCSATDRPTVIVQPRDFRLPDVLTHIEAGKIVLVMPQHNGPDQPSSGNGKGKLTRQLPGTAPVAPPTPADQGAPRDRGAPHRPADQR